MGERAAVTSLTSSYLSTGKKQEKATQEKVHRRKGKRKKGKKRKKENGKTGDKETKWQS